MLAPQHRATGQRLAALLLVGVVLTAGVAGAAEQTADEEAARQAVYERITRNPAIGLGAGRALLFQIANPKIGAGVTDHSRVAGDPNQGIGRLRSTAGLGMALMVGNDEQATAAAAQVNAVHDRVKGTVSEGATRGARYSAHDPRLQVWVLATLVDSMIKSHETFAGPLTTGEKDIFTAEAFRRVGLRLKLRADHLPTTYAQIRDQVRDGLGELEVTPSARTLGQAIAEPPLPRKSLRAAARLVTVGMLPPELRDAYDLKWRARDRALLGVASKTARAVTKSRLLRPLVTKATDKVMQKAMGGGAAKPAGR